jgi:hypothetical protein
MWLNDPISAFQGTAYMTYENTVEVRGPSDPEVLHVGNIPCIRRAHYLLDVHLGCFCLLGAFFSFFLSFFLFFLSFLSNESASYQSAHVPKYQSCSVIQAGMKLCSQVIMPAICDPALDKKNPPFLSELLHCRHHSEECTWANRQDASSHVFYCVSTSLFHVLCDSAFRRLIVCTCNRYMCCKRYILFPLHMDDELIDVGKQLRHLEPSLRGSYFGGSRPTGDDQGTASKSLCICVCLLPNADHPASMIVSGEVTPVLNHTPADTCNIICTSVAQAFIESGDFGGAPPLKKHLIAGAYQLAALFDAAALAVYAL